MKTRPSVMVPLALLLTGCALSVDCEMAIAAGGGINLGWYDCGGQPASLNEDFACDTNAGVHTLVGSFVAPCCVTGMSANEIVMDLQTATFPLAPWWGMRTGLCRPATSLLASFNFTTGPFTCQDYWQGAAVGGITMDLPVNNRARIKALCALPAGSPLITGIAEGTEVYSFKANINNQKTVGSNQNELCTGCQTDACIVLQSIKLNQPVGQPGGNKFIATPATRAFVTWQGGFGDCYGTTPARNTTWGSIKAVYR